MEELLPIVNIEGNVVGSATRSECHGGSFLLHPVVHLHVKGSDGRLLLQLRSKNKRIQPCKWDTAVGGHVSYGEDIVTALQRETAEELGIDINKIDVKFLTQYPFRSSVEYELVYVYTTIYDGPFNFQREEIDEVRFFSKDDLLALSSKGLLTPNFEQEIEKPDIIGAVI